MVSVCPQISVPDPLGSCCYHESEAPYFPRKEPREFFARLLIDAGPNWPNASVITAIGSSRFAFDEFRLPSRSEPSLLALDSPGSPALYVRES